MAEAGVEALLDAAAAAPVVLDPASVAKAAKSRWFYKKLGEPSRALGPVPVSVLKVLLARQALSVDATAVRPEVERPGSELPIRDRPELCSVLGVAVAPPAAADNSPSPPRDGDATGAPTTQVTLPPTVDLAPAVQAPVLEASPASVLRLGALDAPGRLAPGRVVARNARRDAAIAVRPRVFDPARLAVRPADAVLVEPGASVAFAVHAGDPPTAEQAAVACDSVTLQAVVLAPGAGPKAAFRVPPPGQQPPATEETVLRVEYDVAAAAAAAIQAGAAPPIPPHSWFCKLDHGGGELGPMAFRQLQTLWSHGTVGDRTLVWTRGLGKDDAPPTEIRAVPGLAAALSGHSSSPTPASPRIETGIMSPASPTEHRATEISPASAAAQDSDPLVERLRAAEARANAAEAEARQLRALAAEADSVKAEAEQARTDARNVAFVLQSLLVDAKKDATPVSDQEAELIQLRRTVAHLQTEVDTLRGELTEARKQRPAELPPPRLQAAAEPHQARSILSYSSMPEVGVGGLSPLEGPAGPVQPVGSRGPSPIRAGLGPGTRMSTPSTTGSDRLLSGVLPTDWGRSPWSDTPVTEPAASLPTTTSRKPPPSPAPSTVSMDVGENKYLRGLIKTRAVAHKRDPSVQQRLVRDLVDQLCERFEGKGIILPLTHVDGCTYKLGGRKVHLCVLGNGQLSIRSGGGCQDFLEFLTRTSNAWKQRI